ncbi:acyl-CoA dehydrogenase [Streptomyces sp. NPDC047079]|uniref:acyl-CoA dehydrogenase family protein n=1 Tax=Streptomyces sp. NPDC047079 TaxID=3154607 RepID=UPI00340F21CA
MLQANLISHGRLTFDLLATGSLDYCRYSTAYGSVGLAQACLTASLEYTRERTRFGVPIRDHPLVRRMLTDMISSVEAARLLCRQAGVLRARNHKDAIRQTLIAKYAASRTGLQVAEDAVQLHGANGIGPDFPVQRHLRDAKVQEIIEGTSQIQQLQIAEMTLWSGHPRRPRRPCRRGLRAVRDRAPPLTFPPRPYERFVYRT